MPARFILSIALVLLFIGCNAPDEKSKPEAIQSRQYAFIKEVIQEQDSIFLEADYIQYLTGAPAIEAAKQAGQADSLHTTDGNIRYTTPNDYFIVNDGSQTKRIAISKNCKYDLLTSMDRINTISDNSLESFKKIYADSPFLLTIENATVIEIKEVFIP